MPSLPGDTDAHIVLIRPFIGRKTDIPVNPVQAFLGVNEPQFLVERLHLRHKPSDQVLHLGLVFQIQSLVFGKPVAVVVPRQKPQEIQHALHRRQPCHDILLFGFRFCGKPGQRLLPSPFLFRFHSNPDSKIYVLGNPNGRTGIHGPASRRKSPK